MNFSSNSTWWFLLVLTVALPLRGQSPPAFPGAEGPGADASGGRVGDLYHVTNLQDDHDGTIPGSLRYGLNTAPAAGRTIVFDVGGTINLVPDVHQSTHTWLRSGNNNITIAGQTAPGPGITIAGQGAKFSGNNWILRNVKFRPGMDQTRPGVATNDGISNNLQNSIIDHVSISWADDEGLSSTDAVVNSTVQYSIIGEGLNYNDHSYGSLISSEVNDAQLSYHHNLYLHNRSRNPRLGSESGTGAILNFSNNVVYNWSGWAGYSFDKPSRTNFLSNYYIAGSNTAATDPVFYSPDTETKIYHQYGNRVDMNKNGLVDGNTFAFNTQFQGTVALVLRNPFDVPSGHVQSAQDAVEQVLDYVGAQWWQRDPVDYRLTEDVRNGTGVAINHITDAPQDPNYAYDGAGYPIYGLIERPADFDVDSDGMADSWELAHGLNTFFADNAGDFDNDGYTNLEEYLNDLAAFPAPSPIGWLGGNGRYAEIQNWGISQTLPVNTFTNWQPSRLDFAEIKTGTVSVDSVGQHAGSLHVAPADGNTATLNIEGGWLEVADTLEIATSGNDGQVNLSAGELRAGTLSMGPGGSFSFSGGTLMAEVVESDLTNSGGTIIPGQTSGMTQVLGNLDIQAGTLQLGLMGSNAGQYDQILVDGLLTAGGNLRVLLEDFIPELGESFDLLDFGSIIGEFNYDLPSLPIGLQWDTSQIFNSGVLSVTAETSGDFDGDGDVDGDDFLTWQRGYPMEFTFVDREAWERTYGTTANVLAGSKASVPEPHSLNIFLVALLSGFSQRVTSSFPGVSCGLSRKLIALCCFAALLISTNTAPAQTTPPEHLSQSELKLGGYVEQEEIASKIGWEQVPAILKRIVPPEFPSRDFDITDYGAVSGGKQICTEAFRDAVTACERAGGGRVVVPTGTFLTGPIHLKNNVNLHLMADSEIIFSDRFEDYLPVVLVRVGGIELYNYSPLIYARDCSNIAVTGPGKLNGNARAWWEWARSETRRGFEMGEKSVPVEQRVFGTPEDRIRPSFLSFVNCSNILLEDFTIGSGPNWTIHPIYCKNTTIRGVHVLTDGPNNDGIDPDSCRDMLIEKCTFDTGDDCVVLKSGYNQDGWRVGRPTENIIMRDCSCKRGHGGLVIGSEMSGDVRNVFMENCRFEGTDRIVRIKSRADRGGIVENIFVRSVEGSDLQRDAIILNMDYAADRSEFTSSVAPTFRNMEFQDVNSNGAPIAVQIQGMKESPIHNLVFKNMFLTSTRGVQANYVSQLRFEDLRILATEGPTFSLLDASKITINGCSASAETGVFLQLEGANSKHVVIENCDLTAINKPVALGDNVDPSSVIVR